METFNDIIKGTKPVLVDFSAEWCGPCKMMAPILKEVSQKIGNRARIIKIDVDRNPAVARKYQIVSVPTLIVFRNGQIQFRQSGVMQAMQLVALLERLAANN
ncbi:MAG: thioredoxin [Bacteroidales bacterium]|jgi:thioredoxin 1|nr:thioredoxin [Bacteroidales bacterium]MDI9593021.1 thioredoxin [Bacteroidota bacterium]OQC36231.1 MAG: Thioredoxin-like protein [Bacteroidetes bacterium ADurb.Bin041]HNV50685.1 thioredoxin [Bacteroidales bacterium]HNY59915.1 thioredoxin [Bacteroidales bacterium]